MIEREEPYDGFHAVCTNLEDEPDSIVKVNKRWDRILAHLITCFIALIVYRYLEKS